MLFDIFLVQLQMQMSYNIETVNNLSHWNFTRYSGYAWVSEKITNILGLFSWSTTEPNLTVLFAGFLGGGSLSSAFPLVNSPVRTRLKYMCLWPLWSGLAYPWERLANEAKYTPFPYAVPTKRVWIKTSVSI